MFEKLIEAINNKGYVYSIEGLNKLKIEFSMFTTIITVFNNYYEVYIMDENNKTIEHKRYIYPKNVVNYIIDFWEQNYIYQIIASGSGTVLVTTSSQRNVNYLFKELKNAISNNSNYKIINIDDSSSNYYIDVDYKNEFDEWEHYETFEIRTELVIKTGYTTERLDSYINSFKNIE